MDLKELLLSNGIELHDAGGKDEKTAIACMRPGCDGGFRLLPDGFVESQYLRQKRPVVRLPWLIVSVFGKIIRRHHI
jgi:hypothetical protein